MPLLLKLFLIVAAAFGVSYQLKRRSVGPIYFCRLIMAVLRLLGACHSKVGPVKAE